MGMSLGGRDLRLMYETFAVERFDMSEEEYALLVEVLGEGGAGLRGMGSEGWAHCKQMGRRVNIGLVS